MGPANMESVRRALEALASKHGFNVEDITFDADPTEAVLRITIPGYTPDSHETRRLALSLSQSFLASIPTGSAEHHIGVEFNRAIERANKTAGFAFKPYLTPDEEVLQEFGIDFTKPTNTGDTPEERTMSEQTYNSIVPLIRDAKIVGNYFRDEAGKTAFDAVSPNDMLKLELEYDNEHDPYAVKVLTEAGVHIGYIPKEISAVLHALHAAGNTAFIAICTKAEKKTRLIGVGIGV